MRHLEVLYRLSTEGVQARNLAQIHAAAIEAVLVGLRADRASLLLFDPDGVLRFKAARGLSTEYKRAVEGHTPWSPATPDPSPILVPDVLEDEPLRPYLKTIRREGIRSLAFFPLRHEGRVLGKFMAYFDEKHLYTEDEVRLGEMIANHLAVLLARRRADEAREAVFAQREAERAQLQSVVMHIPAGVAIIPRDSTGASLRNVRADDLWPHVESALLGEGSLLTDVLDRGKTLHDVDVPYTRPDGTAGSVCVSASPVHDEEGSVTSAVVVMEDNSERKHSESALRLLADTTMTLAESLDYQGTLQRVAELMVPSFADWCDFDLLNDDGELELVSIVHSSPEKVERAREIRRKYPPSVHESSGIEQVVRNKKSLFVPSLSDAYLAEHSRDEEHYQILRSFALTSAILTPLIARGKVIGTLTLAMAESGRRYTDSDIPYVEEVAQSCALAIDNARLYEEARRELSERERAELALRDSEERYRMLSEATSDYIFSYCRTPEGTFVLEWISEAFERITGYTQEEISNKGLWSSMIHPDDASLLDSFSERMLRGEVAVMEHRIIRKDGSVAWLRVYGRPVMNEETGETARVLGAGQDISARKATEQTLLELAESLEVRVEERTRALATANERLRSEVEERARAEDRLARANQALRTSNRELQDFAYVASHDLQEPLRKIQSFADLLRSDYGPRLDDQGKFYIQRMQSAATRMSDLIKGLLGYSRIRTQGLPFQLVDLREVVKHVISDLEITISETRGAVSVSSLPTIEADPTQMRQLFQNLIGNALKFRDPSRPPVVRIKASQDDAQCTIEIADNGIGFGQQYAERIFAPFQRLHGRAAYPGTGMGLAICRRIVERHSGTITATGTTSEGAVFTITLPLKQEEVWSSEMLEPAIDA